VHAEAGYTGADKRVTRKNLTWAIAAKRGKLNAMPEGRMKKRFLAAEKAKASIRARVEHPFRVIKRQFGYAKVRFRGLGREWARPGSVGERATDFVGAVQSCGFRLPCPDVVQSLLFQINLA
jgi:hypothetical protein